MDFESPLGDHCTARVALAVGAFIELAQCACYFLGLPQELLVCGDLGDALDGEARAVTHPLAKGDAAAGIRGRCQISRSILRFPLLSKQDLTDVVSHPHSLPAADEESWLPS